MRIPSLFQAVAKIHPGLLTGEPVNAADVVSTVSQLVRTEGVFDSMKLFRLVQAFPGLEDDSEVNGADLIDWLNSHEVITYAEFLQHLRSAIEPFTHSDEQAYMCHIIGYCGLPNQPISNRLAVWGKACESFAELVDFADPLAARHARTLQAAITGFERMTGEAFTTTARHKHPEAPNQYRLEWLQAQINAL